MNKEPQNNNLRYAIVIPVYNHGNTVEEIVKYYNSCELTVILVDDCSTDNSLEVLKDIESNYSNAHLCSLPKNLGKGGAVLAGIKEAYRLDYTHVLQVDADAQHDYHSSLEFIKLSQENPSSLICGYPIYDDSVPAERKIGRKITNFWCAVETLSLDIKDAMCGYRIYPTQAIIDIIKKHNFGLRMNFDIEILVKLHWNNVPIIFKDTEVYYPEDGSSNFRMIKDNVAISWLHTQLSFGMVIRFPKLLWQRLKRNA